MKAAKAYNEREFCNILKKNNWYLARTNGGYEIYKKTGENTIIVIPHSRNKDCDNNIIFRHLIKKYNLKI